MSFDKYRHILAKSISNGGISLIDHLIHVKIVAVAIAEQLGMDKTIALTGAILHDIGKASPVFQARLTSTFNWAFARPFRHELASLFFISLVNEKSRPQVIEMIVGHHKSIRYDYNGFGILDFVHDCVDQEEAFQWHIKDWETWSKDALDILKCMGFEAREISMQEAKENYFYAVEHCQKVYNQHGWNPWKGLLVAADVFASALVENTQKASVNLFRHPNLNFYNRVSKFHPLSFISAVSDKLHTLVIAATGAGKTDFLIRRCIGRFFYVLPFQASINAMFHRIKEDLKKDNSNLDIRILHAASRIQTGQTDIEEKMLQDKIGAAIKVLTPHQIAGIVFGIRGYEAMILDLKGCDVILDEIHTYTNVTKSIVLKIIEMLAYFGCRIHIGSATMPRVLQDKILAILGSVNVFLVKLPDTTLDSFDRHIVHKVPDWNSAGSIINQAVNNGEKILIVCNRVKRAQNVYHELVSAYPGIEKMLLHSMFERTDRTTKEFELINKFNKSAQACIVVSTQVVEVSLDINFDKLITECAPLDALIQRFGRINRVRNEATIGKYKHVYVIYPPLDAALAMPYELDIVKKSFEILPDNELLKERDLQNKIDTVFTDFGLNDIDNHTIFSNGEFNIHKLCHVSKSVFLDILDIDTATCICESHVENYLDKQLTVAEKTNMEIPVRYRSIAYKGLSKLRNCGTAPFIIPDIAYSFEMGLMMELAEPQNYKPAYYDCFKNRQNLFERL